MMQAVGGLAFGLLAAFDVERVMDLLQRAVVAPQAKVVIHRAAWRQILRNVTPLASGAQDIHDAFHHVAHIDAPFAAAALGWAKPHLSMLPGPIALPLAILACVAVGFATYWFVELPLLHHLRPRR